LPAALLFATALLVAGATPAPPAPPAPSDPAARALEVARRLPLARHALREARRAASDLKDQPLRAALEAQLSAPWLPPEAWALSHPAEAEAKAHAAGLLPPDDHLVLPPAGKGSFAAAPGGTCPGGHHAYPGGLAVHSYSNLLRARGLAAAYKDVYGIVLDDGWLVAAALWHDTLKAGTLPWDKDGGCPASEPELAGTALHHTLGLAAAILRRLPTPLIWVIAASHAPPTPENLDLICGWIRAAGIVARGDEKAAPCPSSLAGAPRLPAEAFVSHFADADFSFTGPVAAWYASQTPPGWARFDALEQDGSDVAAWVRAQAR
jgi:hypothetical protein